MCTIGNSFCSPYGFNSNVVFKQCDLVDKTEFIDPVVDENALSSNERIRYVAFTRRKGDMTPAWAGVNEFGVSFVAADSYLKKNNDKLVEAPKNDISVFDMYLKIITSFKSAKEAVKMASDFYREVHYADELTDILLIADKDESYFIETLNGEVRIIKRTNGHFVSTNHCRMFYDAAPYSQNHSTYLRLQRAENLLMKRDDNTGIGDLLRDSYYGKTVWSICRYASVNDQDVELVHGPDEDMFYTQASVIFTVIPTKGERPRVICEYVLNNNAAQTEGTVWLPFDGGCTKQAFIGKNENIPLITTIA